MRTKFALSSKGLSMSQAQSISNLCNQRAQEIAQKIEAINNSSKTIKFEGETFVETAGCPIPDNIIELILEKGVLHATQAFLMENIKLKNQLLAKLKIDNFVSSLERPEKPKEKRYEPIPLVEESWGWEQLTAEQYAEYLEAEAMASHIGQFIHKGEKLDTLRKTLTTSKSLQWMEIEAGKKTPVIVTPHHLPEDLLELHEKLSAIHRKHEQKVNYYKSIVKNSVTLKNSEITAQNMAKQDEVAKENELIKKAYTDALEEYMTKYSQLKLQHENEKLKATKEIVDLRIQIHPRFQDTIDKFLKTVE